MIANRRKCLRYASPEQCTCTSKVCEETCILGRNLDTNSRDCGLDFFSRSSDDPIPDAAATAADAAAAAASAKAAALAAAAAAAVCVDMRLARSGPEHAM